MPGVDVSECFSLEWSLSSVDAAVDAYTSGCNPFQVEVKAVAGKPQAIERSTPVDVVFVLDESGSSNYEDNCPSRDCYESAIKEAVDAIEVLDSEIDLFKNGGRAGWQEFSDFNGDPTSPKEHGSGMASSLSDFTKSMNALGYSKGFSAIGTGLDMARSLLVAADDASDRLKVVVLLSDGKENQKTNPPGVANELRAAGVWVYASGMTSSRDDEALSDIVSPHTDRVLSKVGDFLIEFIADREAAIALPHTADCVTGAKLVLELGTDYDAEALEASAGDVSRTGDNGEITWDIGNMRDAESSLTFIVDACDCDMVGKALSIFEKATFSSVEPSNSNLESLLLLTAVSSNEACTQGEPSEICIEGVCFRNELAPQFNLGVYLRGSAIIRGRLLSEDLKSELSDALDAAFGASSESEGGSFVVSSLLPSLDSGSVAVTEDFMGYAQRRRAQILQMDPQAPLYCDSNSTSTEDSSTVHLEYCACWDGSFSAMDCELTARYEKRYSGGMGAASLSLDRGIQSSTVRALATSIGVLPDDFGLFGISLAQYPGGQIDNNDTSIFYWDGASITAGTMGSGLLGAAQSSFLLVSTVIFAVFLWALFAFWVYKRRRRRQNDGDEDSQDNRESKRHAWSKIASKMKGKKPPSSHMEYNSPVPYGAESDPALQGGMEGVNPLTQRSIQSQHGWKENSLEESGLLNKASNYAVESGPNPLARPLSLNPTRYEGENPMAKDQESDHPLSAITYGIVDFIGGLLHSNDPNYSLKRFNQANPMHESQSGAEGAEIDPRPLPRAGELS